jgi:hypothetical protein
MLSEESIDSLFRRFVSGASPLPEARAMLEDLEVRDLDLLLRKLRSIGHPHDHFESLDAREGAAADEDDPILADAGDEVVTRGFFLFIDFVAAAVIRLGSPGLEAARRAGSSGGPYLPYVVQYASEPRLQADLRTRFLPDED